METEIKRLNINLHTALHARFKAAAAAQGEKMTDVLIEFIRQYVKRRSVSDGSAQKDSK